MGPGNKYNIFYLQALNANNMNKRHHIWASVWFIHDLSMGRDRIPLLGDCNCGTPATGFLTVKNILNSFISTLRTKFITIVVKNFILTHPWQDTDIIQDNFVQHYQLQQETTIDGYIHVEIRKGMYGLLQAIPLSQDLLERRLATHGYYLSHITSWVWLHKQWNIQLCLIGDIFLSNTQINKMLNTSKQ